MPRASQPCRQLNSQSIRGNALCYISPIVVGKCNIISAKCTINVKEKNLDKAWRNVILKRDACDEAVKGKSNKMKVSVWIHTDFFTLHISAIKNVAFVFSAISTSEINEARTKESTMEEDSSSSDSDTPCTSRISQESGNSTVKKYYPAISFWIALTTPNGTPANPITIHRALLHLGVKVIANQVITYLHTYLLTY